MAMVAGRMHGMGMPGMGMAGVAQMVNPPHGRQFANAPHVPAQARARVNTDPPPPPADPPVSHRSGCISRIPEDLPPCCSGKFEYVRTNANSQHPFDLGYGAYAVVRKIRGKANGECYAVKIVEKHQLEIRGMLGRLYQEVNVQRSLAHKNILAVCGFDEDSTHCFLQLELCEKGAVSEIVEQYPGRRLPEENVAHIFAQVADGIGYMHDQGIAHRDLKLSNLLVTAEDVIKIADFGWCCDTQFTARRMTLCGTLEAMPPEILENEPHGVKADIWALGIVLFQMASGIVPFVPGPAGITEDFKATVLRADAKLPPDVVRHPGLDELLEQHLLQPKPEDRAEAKDLRAHAWFATVSGSNGSRQPLPFPRRRVTGSLPANDVTSARRSSRQQQTPQQQPAPAPQQRQAPQQRAPQQQPGGYPAGYRGGLPFRGVGNAPPAGGQERRPPPASPAAPPPHQGPSPSPPAPPPGARFTSSAAPHANPPLQQPGSARPLGQQQVQNPAVRPAAVGVVRRISANPYMQPATPAALPVQQQLPSNRPVSPVRGVARETSRQVAPHQRMQGHQSPMAPPAGAAVVNVVGHPPTQARSQTPMRQPTNQRQPIHNQQNPAALNGLHRSVSTLHPNGDGNSRQLTASASQAAFVGVGAVGAVNGAAGGPGGGAMMTATAQNLRTAAPNLQQQQVMRPGQLSQFGMGVGGPMLGVGARPMPPPTPTQHSRQATAQPMRMMPMRM